MGLGRRQRAIVTVVWCIGIIIANTNGIAELQCRKTHLKRKRQEMVRWVLNLPVAAAAESKCY